MAEDVIIRAIRESGNRGMEAARRGRMDLAGEHFNKALGFAEDLSDERSRRDELAALATLFHMFSVPDLARMAAEEAVELDRKLGLNEYLHEDILSVGNAQMILGNFDAAEATFRSALKLALDRKDFGNAASASTNIGNAFGQRQQYAQALPFYESSLEYLKKEPFEETEINTRINLLQTSELAGYDIDRTFKNAYTLCEQFWVKLQPGHRQAIAQFIPDLADRYLRKHPQKNAAAWKTKCFPMIFG